MEKVRFGKKQEQFVVLSRKPAHFVVAEAASLKELDFRLNELTDSHYTIASIDRHYSDFFQNFEIIAFRPLNVKKRKKKIKPEVVKNENECD